jgi:hypothetical protein
VQRGVLVVVEQVHARALLNQQLGALQLAVAGGKVQRGAALLVLLVHVSALGLQQLPQLGGVAWEAESVRGRGRVRP